MENWTNLTASAFTKYRDSFQSAATMLTENIPIKKKKTPLRTKC
jgi:hypothetical protein